MNRRNFLKEQIRLSMFLAGYTVFPSSIIKGYSGKRDRSYEEYVRKSAVDRNEIDVFLEKETWARFDPDLGYILGNFMPRDGIDGSFTFSTSAPERSRASQVYTGRPCRINTYGNSFTQCHQVSDEETWQEYLSGHLGEPVRNFGMGGYGVYQAYRRLLKEETGNQGAEYVILYMWGDDYFRSLLRCRWVLFYPWWHDQGGLMFHGNFWPNIEMDLNSGQLVEKPNLLDSPASLYKMTDPDFMYDSLRDDLMLQLSLMCSGVVNTGLDVTGLQKLADIYRMESVDFSDEDRMQASANRLRNKYAFDATKYILDRARDFTGHNGKKLMIVQFCPYTVLKSLLSDGTRYDQEIVDYIREKDFFYFDMNEVHVRDFKDFNLAYDDYMKRYFIGHYNPAGNHFFAYSIKDKIVSWLDPKPLPYRTDDTRIVDFKGYLPN